MHKITENRIKYEIVWYFPIHTKFVFPVLNENFVSLYEAIEKVNETSCKSLELHFKMVQIQNAKNMVKKKTEKQNLCYMLYFHTFQFFSTFLLLDLWVHQILSISNFPIIFMLNEKYL